MSEWINVSDRLPEPFDYVNLRLSDGSVVDGYVADNKNTFYRAVDDSVINNKIIAWYDVGVMKSIFQDDDLFSELERFNISESLNW